MPASGPTLMAEVSVINLVALQPFLQMLVVPTGGPEAQKRKNLRKAGRLLYCSAQVINCIGTASWHSQHIPEVFGCRFRHVPGIQGIVSHQLGA